MDGMDGTLKSTDKVTSGLLETTPVKKSSSGRELVKDTGCLAPRFLVTGYDKLNF